MTPMQVSPSLDQAVIAAPLPAAGNYGTSDDDRVVGAARYELTSRLMESFLHEARNPLNVLSINVDVLTQRLKTPTASQSHDKYLRAMREQIQRVDTIMRDFAEFLSPEPGGPYDGRF